MTLLLPDRYVWDFWFAPRDHSAAEPWHAFFLQAPRDLPDPNMRHGMATAGHAVSPDLVHWQLLPDALTPGAPGTWDDQAIWTGSIVERAGLYYFFYTGLSRGESGHVQRIGIATSPDLVHWTRHPGNPLLEADPRWYEKLGSDCWHEEAGDVSIADVLRILAESAATAKRTIRHALRKLPERRNCVCATALAHALITDKDMIPEKTKRDLEPIIGKYI